MNKKIMNQKTELESLFLDWEKDELHDEKSFIRDGIVDFDYWTESKVKILFLFKEAYTKGKERFDLSEEICMSAPYRNWWSAARWIFLIRKVLEEHKVEIAFPNINWEDSNELLRSIAIVNIKKSNGKTLSNYSDLDHYKNNDRNRIKAEVDIINPDIVICGRVFNYYRDVYKNDKLVSIENSEKCYLHGNRVVINFWHFANRKNKVQVFNELKEMLKEVSLIKR